MVLLYDILIASFFVIILADKFFTGRWGVGKGLLGLIIMTACIGIVASARSMLASQKLNTGD